MDMLKTPLHDWHLHNGGRMVDFAGWEMPIQYSSIVEEHETVRNHVGLFDISHMGRIWFDGQDAEQFLNHLVTNDVSRMKPGQVRYALVCREDGGILDDVLVYRLPHRFLLVVNGANREKIARWIEQHQNGFQINVDDVTRATAMIAVQGPRAQELLQPFLDSDLSQIKYYHAAEMTAFEAPAVVSRTGYTGEDGFELIVDQNVATPIWQELLDAGRELGIRPCGLGCRDTLRLEAGMPLYGHEMDEQVDPLTAGLAFGVKLEKAGFIGKEALNRLSDRTDLPHRVGLQLVGKRIARQGSQLYAGEQLLGSVTSGTFSPTIQAALAMGYVPASFAVPGTEIDVDIRGKREPARIVALPFYRRKK